jgi:hypothetical protein
MADNTQYDQRITPDFVMECAKVGSVSLFSSQVVISGRRELNLKTLSIPSCFFIEWIGIDGDFIRLNLRLTEGNRVAKQDRT